MLNSAVAGGRRDMLSPITFTTTAPTSAIQFGTIRAVAKYGMNPIEPTTAFGCNTARTSATRARTLRRITVLTLLVGSVESDKYKTIAHRIAKALTPATYHFARVFMSS